MDFKNWLTVQENYNLLKNIEAASKMSETREVVFLCVGNSKVWFDSFGPMIGSVLGELRLEKFIYGNTRFDITSKNLQEFVDLIYKLHINPYIVVFDSCLSCDKVGLCIKPGSIMCAALTNSAVRVGDLSITFNVTKDFIKDPSGNALLLKEVKRVARYVLYCFKNSSASNFSTGPALND